MVLAKSLLGSNALRQLESQTSSIIFENNTKFEDALFVTGFWGSPQWAPDGNVLQLLLCIWHNTHGNWESYIEYYLGLCILVHTVHAL